MRGKAGLQIQPGEQQETHDGGTAREVGQCCSMSCLGNSSGRFYTDSIFFGSDESLKCSFAICQR